MMTEPALGIDIAKLKFNVCLINHNGKLKHQVFANTATGCEQLSERPMPGWCRVRGNQAVPCADGSTLEDR